MVGKVSYVVVAACVVVGCAASDSQPRSMVAAPGAGNSTVLHGIGTSGGSSTLGSAGLNGFGAAGTTQNGLPVAGTGGRSGIAMGTAGMLAAAGGAPGGISGMPAPATAGAAGTAPRSGGGEPVIPAPNGPCPIIATGPVTIMGVTIQVWTGTKSDTQKAPIMIYWHGTGGNASTATLELDPTCVSDIMSQGGVIASMEGGGKGDTLDWGVFTTGDYDTVDQVVACSVAQFNIDTKRIYTSGASAGGLAAGELVYGRSSYMAAANPNSGGQGGYPYNLVYQDPTHIPSVMTMHGAMGVDMVVIDFGTASLREDDDIVAHGGFAVDCDHGGGHVQAPADLKAAGWVFMMAHPFGVNPFPYAGGLPASFPPYCKIITK